MTLPIDRRSNHAAPCGTPRPILLSATPIRAAITLLLVAGCGGTPARSATPKEDAPTPARADGWSGVHTFEECAKGGVEGTVPCWRYGVDVSDASSSARATGDARTATISIDGYQTIKRIRVHGVVTGAELSLLFDDCSAESIGCDERKGAKVLTLVRTPDGAFVLRFDGAESSPVGNHELR